MLGEKYLYFVELDLLLLILIVICFIKDRSFGSLLGNLFFFIDVL